MNYIIKVVKFFIIESVDTNKKMKVSAFNSEYHYKRFGQH